MISECDILLFRFPQTDLSGGKLRPALLIKRIQGDFEDCLVCMISTQTRHQIEGMEIVLSKEMPDFAKTGLKQESLIRTSRLAVVQADIFTGKLGSLPAKVFNDVRSRLADWIRSEESIKTE